MYLINNYFKYYFSEYKDYTIYSNGQLDLYPLNRAQQFLRSCGLYGFTHKNVAINKVVEHMFTDEARMCQNPQRLSNLLRREIIWQLESYIPLRIILREGALHLLPSFMRGIKRKLRPEPSLCVQLLVKFKNNNEIPLYIVTNREKKELEIYKNNLHMREVKNIFEFEMLPCIMDRDYKCNFNNQVLSTLNCQAVTFYNISGMYDFNLINLGNNQFLLVDFAQHYNDDFGSDKCPFTASLTKGSYYHSKVEQIGFDGITLIPSTISDEKLENLGESLKYLVNSLQAIYKDLREETEVNIYYAANPNAKDIQLAQFGWDSQGEIAINTGNDQYSLKLYRLRESYEITKPTIYFGAALGYTPASILSPNNKN